MLIENTLEMTGYRDQRRRRDRRRRVTVVIVGGWALVVMVFTVMAVGRGKLTVPEDGVISQALISADATLGDLAMAIDPRQATISMGTYHKVGGQCRITLLRSGLRYTRTVTAVTQPSKESKLIYSIAHSLPSEYSAKVTKDSYGPILTAMNWDFISIRGEIQSPGRVQISVDTGCRPGPEPSLPVAGVDQIPLEVRSAVLAVYNVLGVLPYQWTAGSARCPSGMRLWAVETRSSSVDLTALSMDVRKYSDAIVTMDQSEFVAYDKNHVSVIAQRASGATTVAVTTRCRP